MFQGVVATLMEPVVLWSVINICICTENNVMTWLGIVRVAVFKVFIGKTVQKVKSTFYWKFWKIDLKRELLTYSGLVSKIILFPACFDIGNRTRSSVIQPCDIAWWMRHSCRHPWHKVRNIKKANNEIFSCLKNQNYMCRILTKKTARCITPYCPKKASSVFMVHGKSGNVKRSEQHICNRHYDCSWNCDDCVRSNKRKLS